MEKSIVLTLKVC